MSELDIDLDSIDANALAAAVKSVSDTDIVAMLDAVGPKAAFDKVFEQMQSRFKPGTASSVDADVVFEITHGGEVFTYTVGIHNGSCTCAAGDHDDPKSRMTMGSPMFIKLVTGNADGPVAFMSGKLKISGDIMFTSRLLGFFERPKAA